MESLLADAESHGAVLALGSQVVGGDIWTGSSSSCASLYPTTTSNSGSSTANSRTNVCAMSSKSTSCDSGAGIINGCSSLTTLRVLDRQTGEETELRAQWVVNSAGGCTVCAEWLSG